MCRVFPRSSFSLDEGSETRQGTQAGQEGGECQRRDHDTSRVCYLYWRSPQIMGQAGAVLDPQLLITGSMILFCLHSLPPQVPDSALKGNCAAKNGSIS